MPSAFSDADFSDIDRIFDMTPQEAEGHTQKKIDSRNGRRTFVSHFIEMTWNGVGGTPFEFFVHAVAEMSSRTGDQ